MPLFFFFFVLFLSIRIDAPVILLFSNALMMMRCVYEDTVWRMRKRAGDVDDAFDSV
jgi:hypothetical protein